MTDALVKAIARETAKRYYAPKHPGEAGAKYVNFLAEHNWDFWKDGATAALQAIEAAGYRVVPVEATDPVPTNPVFDQEEAIRRAAQVSVTDAAHLIGKPSFPKR